jgi:hypothetical protein
MPSMTGSILNRLLGPDPSETTFEKRGFRAPGGERQANLEKIGRKFLEGFSCGMTGSDMAEIDHNLQRIERAYRGFSYEGCAMALGVRDALRPFGRHWVDEYFAGPGADHIYMAHIGVGWAMARVPHIRWRVLARPNDLLGWLALDGYGFHQAYFNTKKYVHGQAQTRLPVFEPHEYANRVVDQGIGRALWFVNGSDPERVAECIGGFKPSRRADLWSGAGLASVYAGGVDAHGLESLARLSGQFLPDVAQAAAFAAKARQRTDLVTPHTELAVKVFCRQTVEEAASGTDTALEGLPREGGDVPVFEIWRRRIRAQYE